MINPLSGEEEMVLNGTHPGENVVAIAGLEEGYEYSFR